MLTSNRNNYFSCLIPFFARLNKYIIRKNLFCQYYRVSSFGKYFFNNIKVNIPVSKTDNDSAASTHFIPKLFHKKYTSGIKRITDFNIFVMVDKYAFPITLNAAFQINKIALNIKNIDKK